MYKKQSKIRQWRDSGYQGNRPDGVPPYQWRLLNPERQEAEHNRPGTVRRRGDFSEQELAAIQARLEERWRQRSPWCEALDGGAPVPEGNG
jgi:hypothetical protein